MTEDEFRHGAPPSPLEARIAALALAVQRQATEAGRELPAVPPDRLEGCRRAAVDLARHAAALCRALAILAPAAAPPSSAGPFDFARDIDFEPREQGEEP